MSISTRARGSWRVEWSRVVEQKRVRKPCWNFPVGAQWDGRSVEDGWRTRPEKLGWNNRQLPLRERKSCMVENDTPLLHPVPFCPGRSLSKGNGTPGRGQGPLSGAVDDDDNNNQELILIWSDGMWSDLSWAASTPDCCKLHVQVSSHPRCCVSVCLLNTRQRRTAQDQISVHWIYFK